MSEESTNAADVRVGEPVVRIEGLRKSFGDNVVLRGIDLEVQRGEVVVILGPSGSGKSTLLRCVNLLETPTDGRIFFEDTEITAKKTDINKVRAKVGMVFQNFNLFPHLTAKKNVMLAQQKVLHRAKEEAEKVAVEQLTRVGLADRVDYKPSELSGGQQQRVAIARALAMDPHVMLFDEATSALDPERPGEGRHDHDRGHPRDGLRPRRGRPRHLHGRRLHRGAGHARRGVRPPQVRSDERLPGPHLIVPAAPRPSGARPHPSDRRSAQDDGLPWATVYPYRCFT